MKCIRSALLSLCLLGCGTLSAQFSSRDFNQEYMKVTSYAVMILSPFDDEDHITAYNSYGGLIWDDSFLTKVMSWKLDNDLLYVFSKSRYAEKTYLTCINTKNGQILWER